MQSSHSVQTGKITVARKWVLSWVWGYPLRFPKAVLPFLSDSVLCQTAFILSRSTLNPAVRLLHPGSTSAVEIQYLSVFSSRGPSKSFSGTDIIHQGRAWGVSIGLSVLSMLRAFQCTVVTPFSYYRHVIMIPFSFGPSVLSLFLCFSFFFLFFSPHGFCFLMLPQKNRNLPSLFKFSDWNHCWKEMWRETVSLYRKKCNIHPEDQVIYTGKQSQCLQKFSHL